jgi:CHAD domain-containing protein
MKEIEWQFDAHDLRPVVRWLEARGPAAESSGAPNGHALVAFTALVPRQIVDTYIDTPDWRFHRAGLAVRVRVSNGSFEASLKTLEPAQDGLRERTEIRSPLASGEPAALLAADTRAGAWARSLAGRQPPGPLFTVRSTRHVYAILIDSRSVGEVVLDETSFDQPPPRDALQLKRVEVEVEPSSVDHLRPFVDDLRTACRLTPATASKFEVGLLALDKAPAGIPDVGPVSVAAEPSMGELGFAVIRRAFLAFLRSEPGTRIGEDIEGLHDMRVAARRMRAALGLFEPALPARARTLQPELRWVASLLGGVRDLDTQLSWITSWSRKAAPEDQAALGLLSSALERRRERARRRMLEGLESLRYARLIARLTEILRRGPPRRSPAARAPALAAFPALIERRHARVRKAGKGLGARSAPEMFHRLRIRCKRLRYAVENASDLYGGAASDYIDALVRVQDILGLHQDAVVAVSRLQDLLQPPSPRMPPRVVFMMGRASQRYEQQAAKLRKRFGKAYLRLQGKSWTRLQKAMKNAQVGGGGIEWPAPAKEPAPPRTPGQEG